jgi:hypothetical protein
MLVIGPLALRLRKENSLHMRQNALYAAYLRSGARTQRPTYKIEGQWESAHYVNGQR